MNVVSTERPRKSRRSTTLRSRPLTPCLKIRRPSISACMTRCILPIPRKAGTYSADVIFFRLSRISKWLESPVSHAYMLSFLPLEVNSVHSSYDHLSHWRAYGDNGCGCSFVITVPRDKLYEVNYDNAIRDATAAKLKRFLDTAAQVWDEVIRRKPASRYPRYEELLETVFATALKSRFLHKHPSYGLERERRAVVAAPEQSEIRTEVIGRNIRHHVNDVEFGMDQVLNSECTITVGPAVRHQTDVAKSLQGILVRNGRSGPKVDVSKIPYRSV